MYYQPPRGAGWNSAVPIISAEQDVPRFQQLPDDAGQRTQRQARSYSPVA
jgi:hypothetical protein